MESNFSLLNDCGKFYFIHRSGEPLLIEKHLRLRSRFFWADHNEIHHSFGFQMSVFNE